MEPILDRLTRLWSSPPAVEEQALADFRTMYTDPVRLNGSEVAVEQLVLRARCMRLS